MTAQQLKNSILQMAVQGKLVPQDPNDEPASVLLERIRAEKERLIKEKKIKREKNPSVIFKGADNTPYEKIGDEVRSLADEVPFDIPDSWEWVRLGTVIELQSGQDMTPDKYNDCGKGIPYITGASNIENGIVLINRWTEYGRAFAYCGDILLTCKGTVGTMAVLQEPQVHIARQIMAIRPISELYVPYIQLVLDTLVENLKAAAKSMIPGIAREDVLQSLFPVPPVSEQKRIVQKVSDLSPCLEQYAAADTKLLSLNTAFPERLKKSILQEAVQGKLVPQDPSDEPAEALLERIRSEKQRLIKEGKIKKDKHESVIFRRDNSHYEKRGSEEVCIDDEIPFEIPENWAWARLSSFGVFSSGKTPSMSNPQFWNGYVPWVTSKDMKRPVITDSEMHISESAAATMQLYPAGTLLLVARSGILKRLLPLCKLGIDSTINQDIKAFSLYDIELSEWLFYGIKAFEPFILKELVKSVTTVESLKFDEFAAMLIPVPPLSEQRRIIAAIKTAMNLLTPLSSNPLFSL
ncbi:MAG: restriction endonuclease subunit S [Hungatella sp.]